MLVFIWEIVIVNLDFYCGSCYSLFFFLRKRRFPRAKSSKHVFFFKKKKKIIFMSKIGKREGEVQNMSLHCLLE
jgi:hypothetical protein